jgi:integrase
MTDESAVPSGTAGAGQRAREPLTALAVKRLPPGRHSDRGCPGLYLLVEPTGARRWLLRTVVHGKQRDMGLGGFPTFSLAEARDEAAKQRAIARSGRDPIAERRAERQQARSRGLTFRDFATDYIANHRAEWKNEKHAAQWESTLTTYAYDHFGDVAIGQVDRTLVLAALKPIWTTKPETASRVRGRIATILDAAKADGLRTGDNPADWKGSLQTSLPKRSKRSDVEHHAALPYSAVAAFLVDLRGRDGIAARALELAILTATRTGEIIGATWDEIDLDERVWNIPAERMKAGKPHRVPLSDAAMALLAAVPRTSSFVFPAAVRPDQDPAPMSNMAMLAVLKRMERTDITVHGFRSTFRDWAGEQTAYPREVIEHALAHQLADKAEAAYQRGDLLRKRRSLMTDWATFCSTERPTATHVTPIRRSAA